MLRSTPAPSNRHPAAPVAVVDQSAKLVPSPSQCAPSGNGRPGQARSSRAASAAVSCSGRTGRTVMDARTPRIFTGGAQEVSGWAGLADHMTSNARAYWVAAVTVAALVGTAAVAGIHDDTSIDGIGSATGVLPGRQPDNRDMNVPNQQTSAGS